MKIIKEFKRIITLLLAICMLTTLVGCGSTDDYESKVHEVSGDAEELVNAPSVEYIIAALSQIDSITGIEIDPDVEKEYLGRVYFTSSRVDQSSFGKDDSVLEKGTSAGGSIDIFASVDEAIERDKYLSGFDGNILLDSGSHSVVGTIVIRTSEKLSEDEQEDFTKEIVAVLTSGNITEDMITQAMKDYNQNIIGEGNVQITFSHEDVYYKHYTEIYDLLNNLGFSNIDYNITEMNYDVEESFDGSVVAVHINDKYEFSKGDIFKKEAPIVISYVEDLRMVVPMSVIQCEAYIYSEVVEAFKEAGFTNVTAVGTEVEYTDKVENGSVILVSVNDNCTFDEDDKFSKNAEVTVHYRIILPKPTPEPEPVPEPDTTITDDDTDENVIYVWIPQSGSKYHSKSSCSNMKNPTKVTKEEAEDMGYEPCKRCH